MLDLIRGIHGLINSDDPYYYQKMGRNYYGNMPGYGPYGMQGSSGLGSFLDQLAPLVHQIRHYDKVGTMPANLPHMNSGIFSSKYTANKPVPRFYNGSSSQGYTPQRRYDFNHPSPQVVNEQQKELDYWNQKKELDHWNNQRNIESKPFNEASINDPNVRPYAKGGPAKQYYVREKMPGYDVGRTIPHMLANYWNPRLDPAGIAGNAMGAEAARAGANYGINRLMGTDGYRWSNPRELTRGERFGRFFTHSIPKRLNKTFGTHFNTDHDRYWNVRKGPPPGIANAPGLLQQGVGVLGNKALNLGSKVHEGLGGLGNIIPPVENMGRAMYNAPSEIMKGADNMASRGVSILSPFARSGVSPWEMDPNFKKEGVKTDPSILSRMYNSLPNWGGNGRNKYLGSGSKPISRNDAIDHLQGGMKDFYPRNPRSSATENFMNRMLAHENPNLDMNDNSDDEFFDARDEYDPNYHAPKRMLANGGYTGNLAPDEFVHRRHHRVKEPNNLDEMIRAYIAHMMEQEAMERGEE